jgi:hypothetical protein
MDVAKRLLESQSPEARCNLPDTPVDDSLYPSDRFIDTAKERLASKNEESKV